MILALKPCRSEIIFSFLSRDRKAGSVAEATFFALYPDTKYFSKDSSSISQVALDDHIITIRVEADDISSLRASLNSYLRLFRLCIDTLSDS
jgi:tRNA threonylcarbamoyladenosine modification (KEOPS) complex  Pcc1 subunit